MKPQTSQNPGEKMQYAGHTSVIISLPHFFGVLFRITISYDKDLVMLFSTERRER